MVMHYQKSDPIVLGSGELYLAKVSEIVDPEQLTEEEVNKLVNIGAIESGANIDIADEDIEIESDNRGTVMKITADKDINFSSGVMTWVLENIANFLMGATYTEEKADEVVTSKKLVVGLNDQKPNVYLRFVHEKTSGGTITLNMYNAIFAGKLNLNFEKKKQTTVDYNFMALANDNKNYIEIIETFE
ncbi:hypothetical protein [Cytobacillus sp. IB215665]|uniref:hypothetical protein n=1 Tax=Cytobacillus sp. IB215665 TaxID=3097357 RepID=UPI002A101518|nr:hypothetical protein [Cytobacillus sp. IB215665]MDX8367858.1 hypothetical protein [Cytobacillus sp. IB215665]